MAAVAQGTKSVAYIPADRLELGTNRPLVSSTMRDLRVNWDTEKMGTLRVARRFDLGGRLRIYDGQHRFLVGQEKGEEGFFCDIVDCPDEAREAVLWEAANVRVRRPSVTDRFNNKIRQQAKTETEIARIADRCGRVVGKRPAPTSSKEAPWNYVACVFLLGELYREDPELFEAAFILADRVCDRQYLGGVMLGLAFGACRLGGDVPQRFLTIARRLGPSKVQMIASNAIIAEGFKINDGRCFASKSMNLIALAALENY